MHWDSGTFAAGALVSGEAAGPEVLSPHTWICKGNREVGIQALSGVFQPCSLEFSRLFDRAEKSRC